MADHYAPKIVGTNWHVVMTLQPPMSKHVVIALILRLKRSRTGVARVHCFGTAHERCSVTVLCRFVRNSPYKMFTSIEVRHSYVSNPDYDITVAVVFQGYQTFRNS